MNNYDFFLQHFMPKKRDKKTHSSFRSKMKFFFIYKYTFRSSFQLKELVSTQWAAKI
jgi:hypothetical protein